MNESKHGELGEFIRAQRERANLSLRRLAESAGISNPYLSQIERGIRKPSAEILKNLARALEISSNTLYTRAGLIDEEHEVDRGVREAGNRLEVPAERKRGSGHSTERDAGGGDMPAIYASEDRGQRATGCHPVCEA